MQITSLHWILTEQEPVFMACSRTGLVGWVCKRKGFDALQIHIPDQDDCSHSAQQPKGGHWVKSPKTCPQTAHPAAPRAEPWSSSSVSPAWPCPSQGGLTVGFSSTPTSKAQSSRDLSRASSTHNPHASFQPPEIPAGLPDQGVQVDLGFCAFPTPRPLAAAAPARSGTCFYSPSQEAGLAGFFFLLQLHSHPM